MRKILLGLTTAVAFGALAVPTVAAAASMHGSNDHSSRSAKVAAQTPSGASVNTNVRGTANVRGTQNFAVNNKTQSWSGQRWACGRHLFAGRNPLRDAHRPPPFPRRDAK